METPIKVDDLGGTPISGNHYLKPLGISEENQLYLVRFRCRLTLILLVKLLLKQVLFNPSSLYTVSNVYRNITNYHRANTMIYNDI